MSGSLFEVWDTSTCLTPEDLSDLQRQPAQRASRFWHDTIAPALPPLHQLAPGAARTLLQAAAAEGLTALQVPERLGGLGLDVPSMMAAVEALAGDPSFIVCHLGHSGIGTLPLLCFGTPEQRARYLPRLLSAELVGAFALTEAASGSDATAVTTRADRSADGRHYVLRGSKMWITNGGIADLFTLFAKVDGTAFTAFLVERGAGVMSGPELPKMGLAGSSTTALTLDDVLVPMENVLGEVGRGHAIAFGALNVGRLQMGALALASAKRVLEASLDHARRRQLFGAPLHALGAIREKLAQMAVRIFAAESTVWRAVGLVDARWQSNRAADASPSDFDIDAFTAFALECALVKVHASEMLDAVVDEGVQIHGGSGYHRDFLVERAYRDSRVNRIFEGTNEVNRLVIARFLLKRLTATPATAPAAASPGSSTARSLPASAIARNLCASAVAGARRTWGDGVLVEQEIALRLADLMIETFAIEATELRTKRRVASVTSSPAADLSSVYCAEALGRMNRVAREVMRSAEAARQPDAGLAEISADLDRAERGADVPDVIGARRRIAAVLTADGRYPDFSRPR